jgi:predicted transcriptional regulator
MNSYEFKRSCETTLASNGQAKWWVTAEDHRFALEVLQLRLRRKILKSISCKMRTIGEIEDEFNLSAFLAVYHLSMLSKALVVEETESGYIATPTGFLYLEKVERGLI